MTLKSGVGTRALISVISDVNGHEEEGFVEKASRLKRSIYWSSVHRGDEQKHVCKEHSCAESVLAPCHHRGRRIRYVSETRSNSIRPMRVWRQSEVMVLCEALILLRSRMHVAYRETTATRSGRGRNGPGSLRFATGTTTQHRVSFGRGRMESERDWRCR